MPTRISVHQCRPGMVVTVCFVNGLRVSGIFEGSDDSTIKIGSTWYNRWMVETVFRGTT